MRRFTLTRFLSGFLSFLLAVGAGVGAVRAVQTITVSTNVQMEVEGEAFSPTDSNGNELPVFIYDGSTYAPVRAMAKALGCQVKYDKEKRLVSVAASPGPDYMVTEALKEDIGKRIEQAKTIQFRDQEGRTATVDAIADPDDFTSSWYARLWFYNRYEKLDQEAGKPADYQGSGIDVVFLDEDGDCLVKYKDISEHYVTINGEYYRNDERSCYLDVERIRRVLDGKPEEFEPEKLFDIQGAEWVTIGSGNTGKSVRVDDPELIAQLTENVNSLEYRRGEPCDGWMGWSYDLTWYGADGREIESIVVNGPKTLRYKEFFRTAVGGQIDTDLYDRLLDELPEAKLPDTNPILALPGALKADEVCIENGAGTLSVTITDPELVERLAENMGNIEFRVGEPVQGSAWDRIDDGRCFVEWIKWVEEDGYSTPSEITICVLDESTIAFYGEKGYYGTAMDGKTIDKALLDQLLDEDGAYAGNPGVTYKALGQD